MNIHTRATFRERATLDVIYVQCDKSVHNLSCFTFFEREYNVLVLQAKKKKFKKKVPTIKNEFGNEEKGDEILNCNKMKNIVVHQFLEILIKANNR